MFWSGGKDSAFALYTVLKENPGLEILYLVTTISEEYQRISMHGVRRSLLEKQAQSIGIALYEMLVPSEPTNQSYEKCLTATLEDLKSRGVEFIVFGDIFLEDLKQYRDIILSRHNLTGLYPIWKRDTSDLLNAFLAAGFRTVTCCISTACLSDEWLGKEITPEFVATLPPGVDPCGENGEFHTFCFEGPVFRYPVQFEIGRKEFRSLDIRTGSGQTGAGFWYIDLLPV